VNQYSEYGANPVIIVVNRPFNNSQINLGSSVHVMNNHVEFGRSYSIKLGIQAIPDNRASFIQNVDNPFVDFDLLYKLLGAVKDDSYVIPVHDNRGGHPILLGKEIVGAISSETHDFDFREVLKKFKRIEISWKKPGILLNINTPEDYEKFIEGV
jgi:molybdenum cofactor cytidylyltransferase